MRYFIFSGRKGKQRRGISMRKSFDFSVVVLNFLNNAIQLSGLFQGEWFWIGSDFLPLTAKLSLFCLPLALSFEMRRNFARIIYDNVIKPQLEGKIFRETRSV